MAYLQNEFHPTLSLFSHSCLLSRERAQVIALLLALGALLLFSGFPFRYSDSLFFRFALLLQFARRAHAIRRRSNTPTPSSSLNPENTATKPTHPPTHLNMPAAAGTL